MITFKNSLLKLTVVGSAGLLFVGCGDNEVRLTDEAEARLSLLAVEPMVEEKLKDEKAAKKADEVEVLKTASPAPASGADSGVAVAARKVEVKCVAGLKFDVTEIKASVGEKLSITVLNPDVMQHNLLIVQPGSAQKVTKEAMDLGGKGTEMGWIPESKDIIAHTKLLNKDDKDLVEVTFDKAGTYPYICSFPGHSVMMKGVIIVDGSAKAEPAAKPAPVAVGKKVEVKCVAGLKFDVTEIKAKVGEKLSIAVYNPDVMQHNLVIVQPGSGQKVANEAMGLGGKGTEMGWIPESKDIIAHTKLLNKDDKDLVEVTFDKAGTYPYICSFPGHSVIMKGVIIVE